jgi:hypothetical protein
MTPEEATKKLHDAAKELDWLESNDHGYSQYDTKAIRGIRERYYTAWAEAIEAGIDPKTVTKGMML